MKFAFYYRVEPGSNETKVGKGDAGSLDDAKILAANAIKAKYPNGLLLNVVEASQAVDPVDLDRVFAFYYRLKPRSSESGIGRVVADTLDDARRLAKEAVAKAHPEGFLMTIGKAKNSPYPVKNGHGQGCPPSLVY